MDLSNFNSMWTSPSACDTHIKRERLKARELRKKNFWQALLQKGECHYCSMIFKREELTLDHVVPLSRGGTSTKGNVVPACKECNTKKKALTPFEMIQF